MRVGPFFEPRRRLPRRPGRAGGDVSARAHGARWQPGSLPRRRPRPHLPPARLLLPREAEPRSDSDGAPAQAPLWLLCEGPMAVLSCAGVSEVAVLPGDAKRHNLEPLLARTP